MNNEDFTKRLNEIQEALFQGGFLKEARAQNFSASDLAQIQIQLAQIATQTAITLEELDIKKQVSALEKEKTRQELELTITRARLENLKIAGDAITSAVQAESIKRSVVDNASINKANAYVQYFNVAMNAIASNSANLSGVLGNISNQVRGQIEKIDDRPLDSKFNEAMQALLQKNLSLRDLGLGNKQVAIIAPKTTLAPGESVTLLGLSTFGDNASEFIYKDTTTEGKFYTFTSEEEGRHKVIFRARNASGGFDSAEVVLIVEKHERAQEKCKRKV